MMSDRLIRPWEHLFDFVRVTHSGDLKIQANEQTSHAIPHSQWSGTNRGARSRGGRFVSETVEVAPSVATDVAGVRTRGRRYPAHWHRDIRNHETCIRPQFRLSVRADL